MGYIGRMILVAGLGAFLSCQTGCVYLSSSIHDQRAASIACKGEVVDQDGRRLKNVTLYLKKRHPFMDETEEAILLKDGTFSVEEWNVCSMYLYFEKDNYASREKAYGQTALSFHATSIRGEDLPKHRTITPPGSDFASPSSRIDGGIQIMLKKRVENRVYLREAPLSFPVSPFQSVSCVDLDKTFRKIKAYSPTLRSQVEQVALDVDPSEYPANRFWVTVETDPQRKTLATFPVYHTNITGKTIRTDLCKKITLHMTGKGAGFILFPTQRKSKTWVMYDMQEAPESGYQPTLVIDAAQDERLREQLYTKYSKRIGIPDGVAFYFRSADGYYGKGIVTISAEPESGIRLEESRAFARVNLRIQGDGSRNLQTND